jgi:hypothetical protein
MLRNSLALFLCFALMKYPHRISDENLGYNKLNAESIFKFNGVFNRAGGAMTCIKT